MYDKYDKYKNKYINLKYNIKKYILNFLKDLLLEEKLKLCYYLYENDIISKLYIFLYNNNIYDINIKYNKILKSKILYNLLKLIIKDLEKNNSEYIKIAYLIPLQNIKNNL
jgi:hypothetical protein